MAGVRTEALVLRARLAKMEGDVPSAHAALTDVQGFATSLGWLPLDQWVNGEIRHLDNAGGL